MDKTNYVLNNKPEPAANETVWAFELVHPLRRDRGEDRGEVSNSGNQKTAVRRGNEFGASLLIPAEFAETKTALDGNLLEKFRLAA